jgi:hypothetical protein
MQHHQCSGLSTPPPASNSTDANNKHRIKIPTTIEEGENQPKPTALANSTKLVAQQPRRPNTTDDTGINFRATINAMSKSMANESKDDSRKGFISLYFTKK